MNAFIQHTDLAANKMVLQSLIPFVSLKDVVLFTHKANPYFSEKLSAKDISESNIKYYQRRVDPSRTKDIREFIRKSILEERHGVSLATLFPSSMILAVSTDESEGNVVEVNADGTCRLTLNTNVFIVDGQHRMMGMITLYNELQHQLVHTDEDEYVLHYLEQYKFNCTVLVNYDLWEQGQVFVNVNFKMKPVNKSLYYEIFGSEYRENTADQKRNKIFLAHSMTKMLNEHPASPFCGHVKMLGTGDGYVSQAFVVEALLRQFSSRGLWHFDEDAANFRSSDTSYFAIELLSYFVAIKELFPEYWPLPEARKGTIICKTTGTGALIRLMSMMRSDEDPIITYLKSCVEQNAVCEEYKNRVIDILSPLKKRAHLLFGSNSEFASSSGQGSEVKLYKRILFELQRAKEIDSRIATDAVVQTYGLDSDELCEKIQEYLWNNVVDDLDTLAHHYEADEIANFTITRCEPSGDGFYVEAQFGLYVTLYLDNEDDSGFSMHFPTTCSFLAQKTAESLQVEESTVKIEVDTDEYYK